MNPVEPDDFLSPPGDRIEVERFSGRYLVRLRSEQVLAFAILLAAAVTLPLAGTVAILWILDSMNDPTVAPPPEATQAMAWAFFTGSLFAGSVLAIIAFRVRGSTGLIWVDHAQVVIKCEGSWLCIPRSGIQYVRVIEASPRGQSPLTSFDERNPPISPLRAAIELGLPDCRLRCFRGRDASSQKWLAQRLAEKLGTAIQSGSDPSRFEYQKPAVRGEQSTVSRKLIYGATAATLAALLFLISLIGLTHRARGWPIVQGSVIHSEYRKIESAESGPSYDAQVKYTYIWGSTTYIQDRIGYAQGAANHEVWKLVTSHPPGSTIAVRVNPANPQEAVLTTTTPIELWFFAGSLAALLVLDVVLFKRDVSSEGLAVIHRYKASLSDMESVIGGAPIHGEM